MTESQLLWVKDAAKVRDFVLPKGDGDASTWKHLRQVCKELEHESELLRFRGKREDAEVYLRKSFQTRKWIASKSVGTQSAEDDQVLLASSAIELGTLLRLRLTCVSKSRSMRSSKAVPNPSKLESDRALIVEVKELFGVALNIHRAQLEHARSEVDVRNNANERDILLSLKTRVANSLSALSLFEHSCGNSVVAKELHHEALELFSEIPLQHDCEQWQYDSKTSSWQSANPQGGNSSRVKEEEPTSLSNDSDVDEDYASDDLDVARFITVRPPPPGKESMESNWIGSEWGGTSSMQSLPIYAGEDKNEATQVNEQGNSVAAAVMDQDEEDEWNKFRLKKQQNLIKHLRHQYSQSSESENDDAKSTRGKKQESNTVAQQNKQMAKNNIEGKQDLWDAGHQRPSRWFLSLRSTASEEANLDPMVPRIIDLNPKLGHRVVVGRQEPGTDESATGTSGAPVAQRFVVMDSEVQERLISRTHAVFHFHMTPADTLGDGRIDHIGYWTVRDLKSTNGVMVNGIRVAEVPLREGDVISFGGASTIEMGGSVVTSRVQSVPSVFVYQMQRFDLAPGSEQSCDIASSDIPTAIHGPKGNAPGSVLEYTRALALLFHYVEIMGISTSTGRQIATLANLVQGKGEAMAFLQYYMLWISTLMQFGVSLPHTLKSGNSQVEGNSNQDLLSSHITDCIASFESACENQLPYYQWQTYIQAAISAMLQNQSKH